MTKENKDTISKLQNFFSADLIIKKEMNALYLSDEYKDIESIIKYTNNANASLDYIFDKLKSIAKDFFEDSELLNKKIELLKLSSKKAFIESSTNISKLKLFYKNYVSDMKPEFIDCVKRECHGYLLYRTDESLKMADTINEILHYMHSSIINNDKLLNEIPVSFVKTNDYDYPISMRGNVENPYFIKMFSDFPTEMFCGITDMVSISKNKLIMMVRDLGHALSTEITILGDKARIEYFIPKICNLAMVNNLPGINKVKTSSVGATGVIEVDIENLSNALFDFLSKVPTDLDIEHDVNEEESIGSRSF